MFGKTFYFSLIRKYTAAFGTIFNDIHITRTNESGDTVDLIKVPLMYLAKDKMLARISADPNLTNQAAVVLPRMSFEMVGLEYDGTRKFNTLGKRVIQYPSIEKMSTQYNPAPYNLHFNLYIYVNYVEDGAKIVEQILPFFAPHWNVSMNLIDEMELTGIDIPLVLNNIIPADVNQEGSFDDRRAIVWTLQFTMKAYFFGPIQNQGVIKFANVSFYIPSTNTARQGVGITEASERITVRPGLTANGQPTSNVSESVALSEIHYDDDYGYITTIATLQSE